MLGSSWVAAQLAASEEGLSSVSEWVSTVCLRKRLWFNVRLYPVFFYFLGVGWDWVHFVLLQLFCLLYLPRMINDEYVAAGGMRIDRGSWSTRRKPAPESLCPPQIPHDLIWARIRVVEVGNRRLTAWAMARPQAMSRNWSNASVENYENLN
jgi:hypothetical protein